MGKDHAKMSFVITKDILDHFKEIPQELRDHIAYSVLNHQTWPNNERKENDPVGYSLIMDEPMPRSVMGADRLQLVGPEGIMRYWAFDAGLENKALIPELNPDKKTSLLQNSDIAHHAEFYMRNLLPVEVPGSPEKANELVNKRAQRYKAIAGTYLWLASTDEIREQIFAPELTRDKGEEIDEETLIKNRKRPLDEAVWSQIREVKNNGLAPEIKQQVAAKLGERTSTDLENMDKDDLSHVVKLLARQMISAPNATVTEPQLQAINTKIDVITDKTALARLAEGVSYVIVMRETLDAEHNEVLNKILSDTNHFPPHSIEHKLATFVKTL